MSNHAYRVVERAPTNSHREYEGRRRQRYPQTWHRQHPSPSAERDYNHYKECLKEATKEENAYESLNTKYKRGSNSQHAPDVARFNAHDHRYLGGLEPQFHAQLVEPSLMAESSARRTNPIQSDRGGAGRIPGAAFGAGPSDWYRQEIDAENAYRSDEEWQPSSSPEVVEVKPSDFGRR
nr:hypothetical protein CFP56_02895 [Quercus suber]